jgi:hypothetical protein
MSATVAADTETMQSWGRGKGGKGLGKSSKVTFDSDSKDSEDEGKKQKKPRKSSWPDEDHVTFSMNDAKQFIYSFGFPKQKGSLKFVSVNLNDCRDSDSVHFTTNCEDYRAYFAPNARQNERFAAYLDNEECSFVAAELGRHDGCLSVFIKHTAEKEFVSIEDLYMNGR